MCNCTDKPSSEDVEPAPFDPYSPCWQGIHVLREEHLGFAQERIKGYMKEYVPERFWPDVDFINYFKTSMDVGDFWSRGDVLTTWEYTPSDKTLAEINVRRKYTGRGVPRYQQYS